MLFTKPDQKARSISKSVPSETSTVGELEMRVLAIVLMVVLTGCATQRGNDRHAQHAADQIRMVAVQREAMVQEAQAESATQVALVEALSGRGFKP